MALDNLAYKEPQESGDEASQKNAQVYDLQKYRELKKAREEDAAKKAEKQKSADLRSKLDLAKEIAKSSKTAGLTLGFSLFRQIHPLSDVPYFLAALAAVLKDVLDIMSFTGVLYFMAIVITILVSIFIALMMILGGISTGHGRGNQKMIRSWLVLLGGTTSELILGISFLPIETLTVLVVYVLVLLDRKIAKSND